MNSTTYEALSLGIRFSGAPLSVGETQLEMLHTPRLHPFKMADGNGRSAC